MEKIEIIYFTKPCGCSKIVNLINKVLITEKIEANITTKNGGEEATKFGIPKLPAILINKKLAFSGYDPSKRELKKYLTNLL